MSLHSRILRDLLRLDIVEMLLCSMLGKSLFGRRYNYVTTDFNIMFLMHAAASSYECKTFPENSSGLLGAER